MGNTFEIHSWVPYYGWSLQWDGESEAEAFAEFKRLKATGEHPHLKLEWR